MPFLKLIILIFSFSAASSFATTITCNPATNSGHHYDQWSELHVPFELATSKLAITLGADIPDWTVLYTAKADIGMSASSCSGNYNTGTNLYYTLLTQEQPIKQVGSDYIYKTDTSGIGISVESTSNNYAAVKGYPSVVYFSPQQTDYGFWGTVKFWKIPGEIPMSAGPLVVTGTEAAVIYEHSGATFASSDANRIIDNGNAYISSSRILTVTMMFQPGTCNIEGDNVNVNMGEYDGVGSHSNWKDASFKLICPDGMGYNGAANSGSGYSYPYNLDPSSSITKNNKKTVGSKSASSLISHQLTLTGALLRSTEPVRKATGFN